MNKKEIQIKVEIKVTHLRIWVNGTLHLSLKIDDLVGIQSYFVRRDCFIDFYTKNQTIECRYTRKDMWERILEELVKQDII